NCCTTLLGGHARLTCLAMGRPPAEHPVETPRSAIRPVQEALLGPHGARRRQCQADLEGRSRKTASGPRRGAMQLRNWTSRSGIPSGKRTTRHICTASQWSRRLEMKESCPPAARTVARIDGGYVGSVCLIALHGWHCILGD